MRGLQKEKIFEIQMIEICVLTLYMKIAYAVLPHSQQMVPFRTPPRAPPFRGPGTVPFSAKWL